MATLAPEWVLRQDGLGLPRGDPRGRLRAMDSDAEYEYLFREEFPAVMRSVFLICHDANRSQDITQDAFVQLLRHWKKVSRYDRPGAWVRRVAIRLAVDAGRRERVRALLEGK